MACPSLSCRHGPRAVAINLDGRHPDSSRAIGENVADKIQQHEAGSSIKEGTSPARFPLPAPWTPIARKTGYRAPETSDDHLRAWLLLAPPCWMQSCDDAEVQHRVLGGKIQSKRRARRKGDRTAARRRVARAGCLGMRTLLGRQGRNGRGRHCADVARNRPGSTARLTTSPDPRNVAINWGVVSVHRSVRMGNNAPDAGSAGTGENLRLLEKSSVGASHHLRMQLHRCIAPLGIQSPTHEFAM